MRDYITKKFYNDHRWNKQIIELRKQEKIYFSLKEYENAEKVKNICEELERQEMERLKIDLQAKLTREEKTLK